MFTAIGQFFKAILAIFIGVEKFANAFVSLASVAEDAASTFQQEEAIINAAKLTKLQADVTALHLPTSTKPSSKKSTKLGDL